MELKPFTISTVKDLSEVLEIPAGTCLLAYRGSIAHGMYIPNSDPNSVDDIDLMGVVLGPPEHYFGLREWGSRGTREKKQGKWDCVFYEIRKMFSLLLQGNPNVMSLLWLRERDYLHRDWQGRAIIENRHLFVGKHVYNAFAGYAHAQLEKMETRDAADLRMYIAVTGELKRRGAHPNSREDDPERGCHGPLFPYGEAFDAFNWTTERLLAALRSYQKKGENIGYLGDKRKQLVLERGYDSKNAAHCVRLLRMCKEFLATGEMTVCREKDGAELLDIKRGKWPLEQVKQHANELFAEIKCARDKSMLPQEPDRDGAEKLLVQILRDYLTT